MDVKRISPSRLGDPVGLRAMEEMLRDGRIRRVAVARIGEEDSLCVGTGLLFRRWHRVEGLACDPAVVAEAVKEQIRYRASLREYEIGSPHLKAYRDREGRWASPYCPRFEQAMETNTAGL